MENISNEITKLLWKVPKMNMQTVVETVALLNSEEKKKDMLRSLRENESKLSKTTTDEVAKILFHVLSNNK